MPKAWSVVSSMRSYHQNSVNKARLENGSFIVVLFNWFLSTTTYPLLTILRSPYIFTNELTAFIQIWLSFLFLMLLTQPLIWYSIWKHTDSVPAYQLIITVSNVCFCRKFDRFPPTKVELHNMDLYFLTRTHMREAALGRSVQINRKKSILMSHLGSNIRRSNFQTKAVEHTHSDYVMLTRGQKCHMSC